MNAGLPSRAGARVTEGTLRVLPWGLATGGRGPVDHGRRDGKCPTRRQHGKRAGIGPHGLMTDGHDRCCRRGPQAASSPHSASARSMLWLSVAIGALKRWSAFQKCAGKVEFEFMQVLLITRVSYGPPRRRGSLGRCGDGPPGSKARPFAAHLPRLRRECNPWLGTWIVTAASPPRS